MRLSARAGFTGAAIEALEAHGRLVLFGTSAGPQGEVPLSSLYRKGITVFGYAGPLESDEAMSAAIPPRCRRWRPAR